MSDINNPYRNHAAMNFGTYLHNQGIDHDDLEGMQPHELSSHATKAGLGRVPSGDTLKMTHAYLKRLNEPTDDPFAGLT